MQIQQSSMLDLLGTPDSRFVIPVYQRVYSWQAPQLRELWDDMMAAAKQGSEHFIGMVFYTSEGEADGLKVIDVIDGQQRMTTITLLLCALRDVLAAGPVEGVPSAEELNAKYLTVEVGGATMPKLELSRADEPTMNWVAAKGERPGNEEEFSKLVEDSYNWFKTHIENHIDEVQQIVKGVSLLTIIQVEMQEGDRPQTVFESLNSKGLPLAVPDLVRNLIIERSRDAGDDDLYMEYFADVDDAYAQDDDGGMMLTHAIRTWLGGGLGMKDEQAIFDAFKGRVAGKNYEELSNLVKGLSEYCLAFHEKVASGDEATLAEVKAWEDARGKAEKLSNNRKIFGD